MALQVEQQSQYLGRPCRLARWIVGRDAYGDKQYLVHSEYPMFLAKIGDGTEAVLAEFSYGTTDGRSLYDFVWFDPFPGEVAFLNLMGEAEDALKATWSKRNQFDKRLHLVPILRKSGRRQ